MTQYYFSRTSTLNKNDIHYTESFYANKLKAELKSFGVEEELISRFMALKDTNVIFTNLFRYELITCWGIPQEVTYALKVTQKR